MTLSVFTVPPSAAKVGLALLPSAAVKMCWYMMLKSSGGRSCTLSSRVLSAMLDLYRRCFSSGLK